jgi:tRNA U34 5-methylaminomethyl-2-thiouridine-forming methyltransferase MnmC
MPRDFDISPYFEVVKPTIVYGFDYTALHWADKQKPLQEVAGEFGVFPETVSPPLVPEETDEETSLPAAEVTYSVEAARLIERVKVTEHFLAIEYIPVHPPEHRMKPHEGVPELAA